MLSNDNGEYIGSTTMDMTEKVAMTPPVNQATTPVAFPQPLDESRSNDFASYGKNVTKMSSMTGKCEIQHGQCEHEESKQPPINLLAATSTASQTPDVEI